jgi:hypothetical protein
MRLVVAALLLIIVASFYHDRVAELLSLTLEAEMRFYRAGIFWAAAMGGYGVVLAVFGLLLPGNQRDSGVRIMPVCIMIIAVVLFFFYLLAASFNSPQYSPRDRLRPGEAITI